TAVLSNGQSAQFAITVHVNSSVAAGTVLSNTATVSSSGSTDPDASNNSANASTTVSAQSDVAITKTGPPSVVAGTDVTYAIAVTNSGPSDAATVSWSDTNYQTTTFVSLSAPAGWSCTTPAAGGTGTTTCSTASLAAGATANFSLTWHVASSSNVLTIQNDITVTAPSDTTNANNHTPPAARATYS